MSLLSCNLQKFWAADDLPGSGGGAIDIDDKNLNADKIYDLLGEEDEEPIPLDDKGKKKDDKKVEEGAEPTKRALTGDEGEEGKEEEEEDEDDELKELEDELEGPDESKLELVTPVRRREILAKYPNLFKDFPYLESAYYREQQFTEIYPTIDDAKVAAEKSQNLDKFERQLMSGNTEELLKTIKAENEGSFHQIVDNYLVALFNTDSAAYYHVLSNINKMTIAQMVQEGKRSQNEALISAATIMNQFIFGNTQWTEPTRLAKNTQNPEKQTLDNERQQFLRQRYETARDDISTRLENAITATIEQNIDKQNVMTNYVKNAACKDAMKTLQKLINNDTRFQSLQKKLWQAAADSNFDKASMDRIRSAFTSRAKTLLPTVLKRARNEALRGMGKRTKEDDSQDVNDGTTKNSRPGARNTSSSSSTGRSYQEKAKQIPKGMTTLEFLNKD